MDVQCYSDNITDGLPQKTVNYVLRFSHLSSHLVAPQGDCYCRGDSEELPTKCSIDKHRKQPLAIKLLSLAFSWRGVFSTNSGVAKGEHLAPQNQTTLGWWSSTAGQGVPSRRRTTLITNPSRCHPLAQAGKTSRRWKTLITNPCIWSSISLGWQPI
jgi:hypothetical protein